MQRIFEVEDLPEGHAQIDQAETGYGAAHPAGSYYALQAVESGFPGRIEQKIIIAPVAQAEEALRDPGQQCEHNAYFQAKNDVENDA